MKIARFDDGRLGLVEGSQIWDLTDACGIDTTSWPPVGPLQFIARFDELLPIIEEVKRTAAPLALADVDLRAPIPWPNKVVAFPVNYHDHAREMKSTGFANVQGFFLKASSSICGPRDVIEIPDIPGREVHHECEIGIVVGKGGRQIEASSALSHIFGFVCLLDMTIRGREERVMRKSYDSFTPIGPWITTVDEITDINNIDMRLWVNDELRQSANTRDLIVNMGDMIAVASSAMTLYPGDIIATGTPAGVGLVQPGDVVTIEVDGLGRMSMPVAASAYGRNDVFAAPYEFKRGA